MNEWNEFLQRQTLAPVKDAPNSEVWLCPLTDYCLISVRGKDSISFLNNNLSNDFNKLSENNWLLNAYCSPKGRALACLRAFMRNGQISNSGYFLRTVSKISENLLKRLKMYVLRAELTLDLSDWVGFGLAGDGSNRLIKALKVNLADASNAAAHAETFSILRLPGPKSRYEIYGDINTIKELWQQFAKQATPVEPVAWRLLSINAGNPEVYPETSEHFVPQMLNLDLLQGISFSKGCYPGQEVVARIHYRGKLKRRMYRFSASSSAILPAPPPATPIFLADNAVQSVGEVVDSCAANQENSDDLTVGLAVLRIDAADTSTDTSGRTLHLHQSDGGAVQLEPLPYEVAADSIDPENNA